MSYVSLTAEEIASIKEKDVVAWLEQIDPGEQVADDEGGTARTRMQVRIAELVDNSYQATVTLASLHWQGGPLPRVFAKFAILSEVIDEVCRGLATEPVEERTSARTGMHIGHSVRLTSSGDTYDIVRDITLAEARKLVIGSEMNSRISDLRKQKQAAVDAAEKLRQQEGLLEVAKDTERSEAAER